MLLNRVGRRTIGIDHSTNVFAYSVFVGTKLERWEEIPLVGSTVYERLGDLHIKLASRFENENIDSVVIEKTACVNNTSVTIKLGMVAGVIIGYFQARGIKCQEILSITWQGATCKPTLTKAERLVLKRDNPGHPASWYTNEARKIRKKRIIDWVTENYGVVAPSDASDAISIGHFASRK